MELSDGEPRVRAGLYGNLGALLMGAAGRLEEALEFTEMSIEAGQGDEHPRHQPDCRHAQQPHLAHCPA